MGIDIAVGCVWVWSGRAAHSRHDSCVHTDSVSNLFSNSHSDFHTCAHADGNSIWAIHDKAIPT